MAIPERVVIALGGNAMTGPDGSATPGAQREAIAAAAQHVAAVVASGVQVVLTHGNGPQVGNLLVKNELAAHEVPPVPLDWCVAQTQATIGFTVTDELDAALEARGLPQRTATLVTRTLVLADDPGFTEPTKPVGRHLPRADAERLVALGQTWEDRGPRGWRRVVASPEPQEVLDVPAVRALADAGFVVVCAGGGGIPVVDDGQDGDVLRGVEAVVDKDLTAAVLARQLDAGVLVIATDVPHVMVDFDTPEARPLGAVTPDELRRHAARGQFARGSMGPKVEAALRFVEGPAAGGRRNRAVITSLEHIADAVAAADVGTSVRTPPSSREE
ncbi:carbamate kinase [Modestobacter sp. I12A-02628]|uniref:Carbamate kinase n=1 Tax=Goekera deserti TaxID=2497753 RepID=A0A7K3WJC2_9ACTN|nr:carbamate kinase [Goekera deserti]MPQ99969.1 carbamate kinase [Goekera deserti]NDI49748.1 carbamate kinase [Goekera deserti]NEL56598.1 carbamate kinase [Goekera deserti]